MASESFLQTFHVSPRFGIRRRHTYGSFSWHTYSRALLLQEYTQPKNPNPGPRPNGRAFLVPSTQRKPWVSFTNRRPIQAPTQKLLSCGNASRIAFISSMLSATASWAPIDRHFWRAVAQLSRSFDTNRHCLSLTRTNGGWQTRDLWRASSRVRSSFRSSFTEAATLLGFATSMMFSRTSTCAAEKGSPQKKRRRSRIGESEKAIAGTECWFAGSKSLRRLADFTSGDKKGASATGELKDDTAAPPFTVRLKNGSPKIRESSCVEKWLHLKKAQIVRAAISKHAHVLSNCPIKLLFDFNLHL